MIHDIASFKMEEPLSFASMLPPTVLFLGIFMTFQVIYSSREKTEPLISTQLKVGPLPSVT